MGFYKINNTNPETGETSQLNIEVRAFPITEPKGNTLAYASVTIDGAFGVHGLSVVNGKNGLFTSMPQTKDRNVNTAKPVSR